MKKDVRNLMFETEPTFIIFKDYTGYSNFCRFCYKLIDILGYISLYDILNHIHQDGDFKKAYEYGWEYKDIYNSLVNAENHKFKRKNTDGSWPICITLPPPIKITKILKGENYE